MPLNFHLARSSRYLPRASISRRGGLVAAASLSFLFLLWSANRRSTHTSNYFEAKTQASTSMAKSNELATFLKETKEKYLEAVKTGSAKDWVVVMGNEAGDLDSLASAVGYAWLVATQQQTLAIPLYQTSRSDLHLRPENLYALELAGLGDSHSSLLCLSDLPESSLQPFPSNRFALVDHNSISSKFISDNTSTSVVAIIDHHADEGNHKDASLREIVVPTGSCASLVANLIHRSLSDPSILPSQLATLLLTATVIDTNGLKPGGKAEHHDRKAAAFLARIAGSSLGLASAALDETDEENVHSILGLAELNEALQTKKSDVSSLNTWDLLRRDYKEYTFTPSWTSSPASVRIGLASVPVGFHTWHAKPDSQADDAFWRQMERWSTERGLDALGVLTSFRDEDHMNKKGNPKHRREQLWLVRLGSGSSDNLATRLFGGLEKDEELKLKRVGFDEILGAESVTATGKFVEGWEARVYKQKNTDATRKVTAPVVKKIVEGTEEGRL